MNWEAVSAIGEVSTLRKYFHLLAVLAVIGCSNPIGEDFRDFDSIGMSETWKEWIVVGSFGPTGPFELVEFKECEYIEPCNFSHGGQGQPVFPCF